MKEFSRMEMQGQRAPHKLHLNSEDIIYDDVVYLLSL